MPLADGATFAGTIAATTSASHAPATPVIGANCSPVGSTGAVTTEPTEERLPFAEESPVRVCMQQTGQTRRECRNGIRESNGLPRLP